MIASFHHRLLILVAVLLPLAQAARARENLFYKHTSDGGIFFQLQNTEPDSTYKVQLLDAISGETIATVDGFKKGAVPKALKVEWKPNKKINAVCHWRVLCDGKNISPPVPQVAMPEKFHVTPGKIKRILQGITWSQNAPSISRVFVANRSGMLIAWAKPWSFSGVGSHLTPWNFKDVGSVRSYRADSDIHAFVQTVPLGKRWIIIGDVKFDDQYSAAELFSKIALPKIPYDFNLSLPGAKIAVGKEGNSNAVYHAHSGMPVRVSLDKASKEKMGGRRFEILLFLNGEFIHEEAQGVDPYTFILPMFPGVTGKHHFTVNIIDYHGNIASKTLAMQFESANTTTPSLAPPSGKPSTSLATPTTKQ